DRNSVWGQVSLANVTDPTLNLTTLALGSSLNPSTYGNSVTFTATLQTNGVTATAATGSVVFYDGATALFTNSAISLGAATCTNSTLSVNTHFITAVYSGDTHYASSTNSPALSQAVNVASAATTTTVLASSLNPSTNGNSVTFTATVQTNGVTAAAATGTVTFLDGATTLGTGTVSGGVAGYTSSTLTAGSHSITAVYGGDSNYATSTSSVVSQVVNASTTAALISSLNPSGYGNSVTFTATVQTNGATAPAATGTVTFLDGATALGTGTALSGGISTYATAALAVGSHSITAVYSGDSLYVASTSSALSQVVNAYSPGTLIAYEGFDTGTAGTTVLDGYAGSVTNGWASLSNWKAQFGNAFTNTLQTGLNYPGLQTGGNGGAIISGYNGVMQRNLAANTPTNNGDVFVSFLVVNPGAGHNASIWLRGNSSYEIWAGIDGGNLHIYNNASGWSGTAAAAAGTNLLVLQISTNGTLRFYDNPTALGGAAPATSTAALTVTGGPTNGFNNVGVRGDSGNPSPGAGTKIDELRVGTTWASVTPAAVVAATTTTTVASSLNPSTFGNAVTFTVTVQTNGVTATGVTGSVIIYDGATALYTNNSISSGVVTYATSVLSIGSHSIMAAYSGDNNYSTSSSSVLNQTVNQANPVVT
ncbi:MAG: Ig-like domain-containing protein, partial [Verrucomicrobiota bacterium]